jgi:FkbM family methyltransferase
MSVNELAKRLMSPILGKKILQGFFESLHAFSLAGMNVGRGGSEPSGTGEGHFLKWLAAGPLKDKDDLVLFDVGANIGEYTKLLRDSFSGKKARLFSFEPQPAAFAQLEKVARDGGAINTYNFGLSDQSGKATMWYDAAGSVLGSLHQRDGSHHQSYLTVQEEVRMETLDEFCENNQLAHIDFLKLDVEGHELRVFAGGEKMLGSGRISVIQFEFGECNIASRTYFQEFYNLLKSRYQIYRIVKDGLYPINQYRSQYEMFLATNYVAIDRSLI